MANYSVAINSIIGDVTLSVKPSKPFLHKPLALAKQTFERSVALAPLCSRPLRAMAALHKHSSGRWADAAASPNPLVPGAENIPPTP